MDSKTHDQETIKRISAIKERLSRELLILTHHYQRKEIVDLGDEKGDSFGLSRKAA
ncbi:MAG: quinolinate synthase NadA, partial [Thermodesulfobacteriota bacterium]